MAGAVKAADAALAAALPTRLVFLARLLDCIKAAADKQPLCKPRSVESGSFLEHTDGGGVLL